jgi:hypothetical protein
MKAEGRLRMKTFWICALALLTSVSIFAQKEPNQRYQSQIVRLFAIYVPSDDYGIDWGPNRYGEVLNIKFPAVLSPKTGLYIIPNLNIQIEKATTPFDTEKELMSFIDSTKQSPLNSKLEDRQIDGVHLQNSVSTAEAIVSYLDKNRKDVNHIVLVLLGQYEQTAVRVIFDSTEDVFESVLDTAKEIISSVVID